MLNFALKYRSLGLSVIPLRPRGKEPLIPWAEFQKRIASEEEIRSWFRTTPFANLGIVTGKVSGIAVIDLDGPDGLQSATELKLTSGLISITGSGRHLWYTCPNAATNIANSVRLYPGLDIRGEGGYVVAPPSIHESGKRYCWLRPLVRLNGLPPFPQKLIASAGNTNIKSTGTTKEEFKPKLDIAAALEGMKDGNIDSTLFTVCSRLRADGYSADDARILLQPHADRVSATPGHLDQKIQNVWSRYEPTKKVTYVNSFGSITSRDSRLPMVETPEMLSNAETLECFFKAEEEVRWIVPGLVASNSLGFVVGLPETNKTWALIDLAIEAARGGKWLDVFDTASCKVWFIDQERFRGETKRRFKALFASKGLQPADLPNLRINSGNTSFKLDLDNSFTAFRKRLEEMRPDLVIIDSFATFHTKEENNRKDIQEVLERLKSLRNEFKCTFLLIHHENKMSFQSKEEGKEPSLAEMSGNIAIPAAAETVITVRKRIDGSSLVYHTKSTMFKQHKPFEIKVNDLDGPNKIEVRGYL